MLAVPAWGALAALAIAPPLSAALIGPANMMMLCTSQGVRWVPAPPGFPQRRDDGCGKPCHALCQRKKMGDQSHDEDGSESGF